MGSARQPLRDVALAMSAQLLHRGPDAGDVWSDEEVGIAFGHRRLAIIDVSDAGRQPMHSASGRYVLTFNGEIYNFASMRADLEQAGQRFRGHSDTEVLLGAIEAWGLDAALQRSGGMFALGLWDRREQELFLVRDRLGEKPLYYGHVGGTFVFASELKALRSVPEWVGKVDPAALRTFLEYGYVPAPASIYAGIHKVCPERLSALPGAMLQAGVRAATGRLGVMQRAGRPLYSRTRMRLRSSTVACAVQLATAWSRTCRLVRFFREV